MRICIFGASSNNIDRIFIDQVEQLAYRLALRGDSLVTGGGRAGLMGAANRGFKKGNGYIISISPKLFNVDGILYEECNELHLTKDLVDRKQMMIEISDAFIVAPGGTGTFDEFLEVYVQNNLGFINKPVILFNIDGFYQGLWDYLEYAHKRGFLPDNWNKVCKMADNVDEVMEILR